MLELSVHGSRQDFTYDYTLTARAGVTAIWGKSGAGKTSLLRVVAGLDKPNNGRISADDEVWFDPSAGIFLEPQLRRTGYVFQDSILFEHLTVEQNLTYSNRIARRRSPVDRGELIELLDIGDLLARKPANLSGGEQRRVAIGRAICSDPKILLLDEPFSGLDEARISEVAGYIQKIVRRLNVPTLLVTHQRRDVVRMASQVVIVEDGCARDAGSLDALFSENREVHAQSVLIGKSIGRSDSSEMVALDVEGQRLNIVASTIPEERSVRLLIDPEDVLISTNADIQISARNRLSCTVSEILPVKDGSVTVKLLIGSQQLNACITPEAVSELQLSRGSRCVAVLKSTSLGRQAYVAPDIT